MIIKALKTFSDGIIAMHEGEIANVPDAKAQRFIAEGYAVEYTGEGGDIDLSAYAKKTDLAPYAKSEDVPTPSNNLFLIAHRGLKTDTIPYNTINAFINAIDNGYKWLEIDARPTSDNVLVLVHDATATLYKNGISESVVIANTSYAELLEYTIDIEGNYTVDTLSKALYMLKQYDVNIIIDLKDVNYTGDTLKLACDYGMAEHCIVSTTSVFILNNLSVFRKYKHVALRITPNDYSQMVQIVNTIDNKIYLDLGVLDSTHMAEYLPYSLALKLPIIVAQIQSEPNKQQYTKHIINVASGIMGDNNPNYEQLKALSSINVAYSEINTNASIINIESSEPITLSAQNTNEGGGYINMYSENPSIAKLTTNNMGTDVTATITPITDGITAITMINGTSTKNIPINIAKNGYVALIGDNNDTDRQYKRDGYKVTLFALQGSDNIGLNIKNVNRYNYSEKGYIGDTFSTMQVPTGATTLTATIDTTKIPNGVLYVKEWDNEGNYTPHPWNANHNITLGANTKFFSITGRIGSGEPLVENNAVNDKFSQLVNAITFSFS